MTEIDKMFENAGVKKCNRMLLCPFENQCEDCEFNWFPDFTEEKQIELIKWLCQKTYRNYLLIRYNFTNYYWQIECNMTDSNRVDNFSEALASVCNNLWQDLTDQEKEEIRNILK